MAYPGERGYLRRSDGIAHTAVSLSLVARIPAAIYEDAIPALKTLGWLEEVGEANTKGFTGISLDSRA
jgi:hypothetical protein